MPDQPREYRDELERICARNLLRATDEIIYFKDLQSRFIWLSRGWGPVAGRDPEELLGLTDFDIYGYEHAAAAYADEQRIIATGVPVVNKKEHEIWPDRPDRWVTSTKLPLRDDDGRIIGTFGISRDITGLVDAEAEARRNAEALATTLAELSRVEIKLRTVLDTSPDAVALYDTDLRYQYVNVAAERLLRQPSEDLLGRTDREVGRREGFLAIWETALREVLATGEARTVELSFGIGAGWRGFQSHLAAYRAVEGGPPAGVVASTREVTELKRIQDQLAHQAVHDSITGLANRVLLMDRLTRALRRIARRQGHVVLLFIDLDGFKEINDTYGHSVGDRLLVEVGQRLADATRQADTVARFGGDEFVILCEDVAAATDARTIAERAFAALGEPFTGGGLELYVTASVGVVVCSDPDASAEDLVRDADAAMYQAKEGGRNRIQFFDAILRDRAADRYVLETDLQNALGRGQFRLEYQPLFRLSDQCIVGAEALIRWDHPVRGCVPPAAFIAAAECRGLIVSIGAWVLDEACRQLAEWSARRDPAEPPLRMAVNVSGRQLRAADFTDVVKRALADHRIAPTQVCLEITETVLLEEATGAREAIKELSALGVRIALDDFGTGYSSLAHLLALPVDVLKLDRSFVNQLEDNDRGCQIVAAVTAMAHVLGMRVVGEGVETTGQLKRLSELECDEGQGYLLSRPVRPAEMARLLHLTGVVSSDGPSAPPPGSDH